MRLDPPEHLTDLPNLARALIDCEIAHHTDEALAHVHVALHHRGTDLGSFALWAARVHGRRLRAWRIVKFSIDLGTRIAVDPQLVAEAERVVRAALTEPTPA